MKIRAFDIKYDTDGKDIDLSKEIIFENVSNDTNLVSDKIADMISDKTDYCVEYFRFEIIR